MSFTVTWRDPEIIILSEVSQTKTNIIQCCLYVEYKEIVQMSLSLKHRLSLRSRKQVFGYQREKGLGKQSRMN